MTRPLRSALILLLALALGGCSAPAGAADVPTSPIACDASRDERERLARMLATGGELAGRTLELESGCKVLLGSPGRGGTALRLASHTRIECADATAGFVLSRQSCRGGDLPGAACDPTHRNEDCPGGGTCVADADGAPFAPDEDAVYTAIGAEQDALATGVSGCSIWVNGVSGDSTAFGGSGARYGYCGEGPRTGFSCSQTCNADSGVLAHFACGQDSDCQRTSAAGRCLGQEQCGRGRGPPPPTTAWGPSGKGFINPIDLGAAVGSVVKGVTIFDHRKGLFAIRVGSGGRRVELTDGRQANTTTLGISAVESCTTDAATTSLTPLGILSSPVYDPRPFVDTGIVGGAFDSAIDDNHVTAYRFGIRAFSGSTVRGNAVAVPVSIRDGAAKVDDSPHGESLPRGVGILVSGNQTIVSGNRVGGHIGLMLEPDHGFNVTVTDNRFFGGSGSKIVVPSGSGAILRGNYLAWGSSDNLDCTAPGQPLECCEGNARGHCTGPGVIRIGDAEPEGRSGSTNHLDISGNFLHSDQAHASYLSFDAAGRRCAKGDRAYRACATDTECPDVATCNAPGRPQACCTGAGSGSCIASCQPTVHGDVFVSGNHFYRGAALQTALDLSRLRVDATTIKGMTVGDNRLTGFARGVILPQDDGSITGLTFLANDFTDTATSSVCTAKGVPLPCCSGPGTGTCSVYEGWRWTMGERRGDAGLTPYDEQPVVVHLPSRSGSGVRVGDAVALGGAGRVERAGSSSGATGIALVDAARVGDAIPVAVAGVASCRLAEAAAAGSALSIGSPDGGFRPAGDESAVTRALTSGSPGDLVRCLLTLAR